ncbi:hypothetical protein [Paenibacillus sp. MER 99-2]|uniref:hypothetical protein n=1 Tax=Paenibacillus sp. MER 99-2 TaxID=2939572 RepID=UPI00203B47C6|nr:hypothetical protein [Paenibacillus sp. MER 99-2]MCM3172271.1 hypothetical protein [Paenibacillus sp. MER 99-2]
MNFQSQFKEDIVSLKKLLHRNQDEIIKKMNDLFVLEKPDVIDQEWYSNKLKVIKNQILVTANQIDKRFIVPLFIFKGSLKGDSYQKKQNFGFYSTQARIFSLLFSLLTNSRNSIIVPEKIEELYDLCLYYFHFIEEYHFEISSIEEGLYHSFKKMSYEEAQSSENIYSYQIKNRFLIDFLRDTYSDKESLQRKVQKLNMYSINKIVEYKKKFKEICSDENDGYYMIETKQLRSVIDTRLQKLVREFSSVRILDSFSPENDFIFAVNYNDFTIIDFPLMLWTCEFIDNAILWGHYEKIYFKRLFEEKDKRMFTSISEKYNKLLTHYIADHLKVMGYILPYDDGGKKPTIELKKPRKINFSGDIDVLAFSPYSKCILNIEFKNYQMSVQNENYYRGENSRVYNDNIFIKTKARGEVISKNYTLLSDYLKINQEDIKGVKNIIITTRLNFSLFAKAQSEQCLYYSWNAFYESANKHCF